MRSHTNPLPIPTDPDALLRVDHVMQLVGCGRTTLWQMTKRGDFPRPVKIGQRSVAWPRRLVTSWIESRPTA